MKILLCWNKCLNPHIKVPVPDPEKGLKTPLFCIRNPRARKKTLKQAITILEQDITTPI